MAYITLNKNNFFNNLDIISRFTKTKDKIALVLKDNAYGHGLIEMATLAQEYGVQKAVVQNDAEAKKIEQFFEYILVLADIPTIKSEKIRYTINDKNSIQKFPNGTKVELKVDTGMHRNGIAMHELQEVFEAIKEHGLILEAVFTHHKSADELTSEWFWQNDNFAKIKEKSLELAKKFGFENLRFHSANSASLMRHLNFDEDMARIGIAAYGCMNLPSALHVDGFKPVLSLYAQKISSRKIQSGERIGYGGTYEALQEIVVSNYNFGYGDGFFRVCSNNYTTPHQKVLVGRISMDNSSFICDDDEILIFNDASLVAKVIQTVSYEVLTSLKEIIVKKIVY